MEGTVGKSTRQESERWAGCRNGGRRCSGLFPARAGRREGCDGGLGLVSLWCCGSFLIKLSASGVRGVALGSPSSFAQGFSTELMTSKVGGRQNLSLSHLWKATKAL